MDLISKPRSKSLVWMYFGLKADEKGQPLRTDEAICRLCRKIVLAKGGNTTNLRSHLKRRHGADFIEPSLSSPLGTVCDTGFEPNPEELIEELQSLSAQSASNHYVPDTVLPSGEPWLQGGPSRAVLSLPSCLGLSDNSGMQLSETDVTDMKVIAKCHLHVGVMFGPFVGEMFKGHVPDNLKYAWAIRDEAAFIYVDGSDANKSNWMRFVTYTSSGEEHNLTVFQFYRRIYYKVSQPITEGAELKVWVGRDYASLLGLGIGDNIKCEVGDKETFLRPLQDIQLVTLPEPSSSSLWSDQSQSQSPMPIISEVTSINLDVTSDAGSAVPSSSQGSFPSPYIHPYEKYDFLPGTERLLSNPNVPNTSDNSVWYFFGFEPDQTGRPLDRSIAVCKLCGDRLGYTGSTAEIQSHLMTKHHIRPRENSIGKERQAGQRLPLPVSPANVMDSIIDFLIMDLQPPAIVQGTGFKQLIHSLAPFARDLPSQPLLEIQLKELHTKGKRTMAHMLRTKADISDYMAPLEVERNRKVPHLVNFSVDVWFHTWQGTTEMYLTLWVHYIDASFNSHNRALATQKLTKSGLNLKAVESQVKAMAEEWGIFQPNLVLLGGEGWNEIRVVPMSIKNDGEPSRSNTHPNSTTFLEREDSASPEEPPVMEQSLSSEELPSIPCFFSAVQSCMEEVMSHHAISKTLSHFQNILSAIFVPPTQSRGSRQEYAEKLLEAMTKEEQVEVKLWGHSRPSWNKLYLLLNTLSKHKSLVRDITKELNEYTGFESTSSGSCQSLRSEWKVVEDLCLVLKPLDVACQTLAKEDFPRLSLVKPILTGLLSRHLVTRPGDSSILKEVKMMMKHNLTSWYDNPVVNRVLCVACAVDPQFHALRFMEEKEQTDTFEWLKSEAVRIAKESKPRKRGRKPQNIKRSPSPSSPEESLRRSKRLKDCNPINFRDLDGTEGEESDDGDPNDTEWVEPPPNDGLSGMEFLLGDLYSSINKGKQSSVEESVDMEMSVFKADKGASLGVEPLQWWKTKAVQLPLLATVAQAYLAAPAVAGIATQDFLQEGAGCSRGKRSNIPPENLDAILFLHHNRIHKTKPKQS